MKITVMSDLHLECSPFSIVNSQQADVLILAGDIMVAEVLHDYAEDDTSYTNIPEHRRSRNRSFMAHSYREFLQRCSSQFKDVIYVAGNHEFYHGAFYASLECLRNEAARYPNIHFLEQQSVTIQDVTFVGGTLWTDMNKDDPITKHAITDLMNDFSVIRNDQAGCRRLLPDDVIARHEETKQYIRQVCLNVRDKADPAHKVVVVGHHSPSFKSIHPRYAGAVVMNGAFHSDLSEFILDHEEIVMWVHGHTHSCFDYNIGSCRVLCNPRGYETLGYSENTGWNPNLVVEV